MEVELMVVLVDVHANDFYLILSMSHADTNAHANQQEKLTNK